MQYFGGKTRIAKYIVEYLEKVRKDNQIFIEPFVGGANIISKMSGVRYGYDINEYLIEMYNAVKSGYLLPDQITEEQYKYVMNHKDEDKCLTGFVGFGCSFSGKWFGGYAKNKRGDNYCLNAKNSLLRKIETMKNCVIEHQDYKNLTPHDCLVYCDPPYKNTTKFTGSPPFNTDEFWETMRKWSKDNDVYISEYEAPNDFKCVLTMETKTDIRGSSGIGYKRIEKLFTYNGL